MIHSGVNAMKNANRGISHEEYLIEQLKDPEYAAAYLSELFKDSDDGAQERILVGLHRMAKAHGISNITGRLGLSPAALFRALSPNGNPRMGTLLGVLREMGLSLKAVPQKVPRQRRLKRAV